MIKKLEVVIPPGL
jgi:hypothetical protein